MTMAANGMESIQNPLALARSDSGNHRLSSRTMAGRMQPSAKPTRKRTTRSCVTVCMKPVHMAKAPQASSAKKMSFLALQRSAQRPPGICRNR